MKPSKTSIPVVEVFGPTIQGEGALAGVNTWFVRLGACDYLHVCGICDSMHAVDPKQYKKSAAWTEQAILAEELIQRVAPGSWITISGGNPAMWDLTVLVKALQQAGLSVAVETQGSRFEDWLRSVDLLTIAPKGPGMLTENYTAAWSLDNFKAFLKELYAERCFAAVAIKIPIFNAADLDFAESVAHMLQMLEHEDPEPLYLSVGNPSVSAHNLTVLRELLLKRYTSIVEQVLQRPKLQKAIVLPQLHVLCWGNKQGV